MSVAAACTAALAERMASVDVQPLPVWAVEAMTDSDGSLDSASAELLHAADGDSDGGRAGGGGLGDFDDDGDEDESLLGSLDSFSPPASPPLESVVSGGGCSSEGGSGLSPARATYLHTLLKRFPCPSQSNMSELLGLVLESAVHHSSQSIVNAILLPSSPWLPCLYQLCAQLEADDDVSELQALFSLLVAVVNLHDSQLLSVLFDARHALHTLTVLEYDPAIVQHLRHSKQLRLPLRRHWQALRDSHCVSLPFHAQQQQQTSSGGLRDDGSLAESVSDCLHQLHRLQYAKDVVLLAHLDDPTAATLSQLCSQQRLHVIHAVQRDTTVHQLCRGIHVAADAIHSAQLQYAVDTPEGDAADIDNSSHHGSASKLGQYR